MCNKCCNLFYCSIYFILLHMKSHPEISVWSYISRCSTDNTMTHSVIRWLTLVLFYHRATTTCWNTTSHLLEVDVVVQVLVKSVKQSYQAIQSICSQSKSLLYNTRDVSETRSFKTETEGPFHQTLTGCQNWLYRPIWRKFGHLHFSNIYLTINLT